METKDKIYSIIIGILVLVILFLRSCTPSPKPQEPEVQYLPGKEIKGRIDTVYQDKSVYLKPEIPQPKDSDTLSKSDTCPPIVENTYEIPVQDSLLAGSTSVKVVGTLKEVILDYTVKEAWINSHFLRVDTIQTIKRVPVEVKRNMFFVGVDLGINKPAVAAQATLVLKKGSALNLRYDPINQTGTLGGLIKIGK